MDFGTRVREIRERRGISLRAIAATTKISVGALEALERNDVSSLPGGIFTRAFVRSYAAEVGLDPEETLREFLAEFPLEGATVGDPSATESQEDENFESQRKVAGTLLRLVGLSIPLAGLIVYFSMGGSDPVTLEPDSEAESVTSTTTAGDEQTPSGDRDAQGGVVGAEASEMLTIDIHPEAPCWVSLTMDGELVFSRLMQPGEREVREAREEILLNVGDAGAFAYTLNHLSGRPLGTSGEVVTVRIDQNNYRNYVTR